MLTSLVEKGRSKCELYFPLGKKDESASKSFFYVKTTRERDKFTFDTNRNNQQLEEEMFKFEELNEVNYGIYKIKYVNEFHLDECIIRHLELSNGKENRLVRHYWFPNWQDHKMANPQQLLTMAMHLLDDKTSGGPAVVHCSAGIGRTGCFLAILNGLQQLKYNYNVDVLAILCSLRLSRGGMIQTAEQYELVHRVLNLYADSLV